MKSTQELRNLVKIHCKAEGPVSFNSIYRYCQEQSSCVLTAEQVAEAIMELKKAKVIENYDSSTWW